MTEVSDTLNILDTLNKNKNLVVFPEHSVLSVYDDNFYDRSDFDAINSAQKKYLKSALEEFKYTWKSGRVLETSLHSLKFLCPKPRTLMSSPYDILDFETLQKNSIFILTPTQMLGHLLKQKLTQTELKKKAMTLISKTPVNLLKLKDGLRGEPLTLFNSLLADLTKHQKSVIESPNFISKRQIGSIF